MINAAAPCMGLLTGKGPPEWHPAGDNVKSICKEVARYCKVNYSSIVLNVFEVKLNYDYL